MKHNFLLDENILYLAVKGVDEQEKDDFTAAELIRLIGRNCHCITINPSIVEKYWHHLKELQKVRSPTLEPVDFINQFIKNSAKARMDYSDLPELPSEVQVPEKDRHIVRAALSFHSIVVTSDKKLREAITNQPILKLKALSVSEA